MNKKILVPCLMFSGLLITLGVFYSCTKSSSFTSAKSLNVSSYDRATTPPPSDATLTQWVSLMISYHNPGLDKVYNDIHVALPNGVGSAADARLLVDKSNLSMQSYLTDKIGSQNLKYSYVPLNNSLYKYNPKQVKYSTAIAAETGTTLSTTLRTALDEFYNTVQTQNNTTFIISSGNSIITRYLPQITSTTEKTVLLAVVKTGIASMGYWIENKWKWDALNKNINASVLVNVRPQYEPDNDAWKDAAWGDCVGAATGAIRGAIAGATVGTIAIPGIGTVAGGAGCALVGTIGGAITGSVAAGAQSILRGWLGW